MDLFANLVEIVGEKMFLCVIGISVVVHNTSSELFHKGLHVKNYC